METSKLTIDLPKIDADFLNQYAESHGSSVSQLIKKYVKLLQNESQEKIHPDIQKITGILPHDIDVQHEYHRHLLEKHQ